jgi:DNA modification methylase
MKFELHHGDCLEVMATMADNSVDMVCADPPYGTTNCAWDSVIPLEPMWAQLKRICKPNGAIVMTASQPFTTALISSNLGMFRYENIWRKTMPTGFLEANRKPLKSHENILVFAEKQPTYNPQFWTGSPYKRIRPGNDKAALYNQYRRNDTIHQNGKRYPTSVFDCSNSNHKSIHPTQKPVALMDYLIRTYTNPDETVLDFTMGSGTTGVAALLSGRRFIGIEKDADYFAIAQERIETTGTVKPKTTTIQGRKAVQVPLWLQPQEAM